jgi:hypothetical protein
MHPWLSDYINCARLSELSWPSHWSVLFLRLCNERSNAFLRPCVDSLVNFTQIAVPLDRMRRLRKLKVSCSNISPAALLHVAETCSDLDELLIVSKALSLELIGALMTAPIASRLKRVSVPSGFINASVQTFQSLFTTFNSLEQLGSCIYIAR